MCLFEDWNLKKNDLAKLEYRIQKDTYICHFEAHVQIAIYIGIYCIQSLKKYKKTI